MATRYLSHVIIGVEEVQDSFWGYFNAGKQFAKRQSMWDAMFMGIRRIGRDESIVEYALKVLLQVLINFSMVRTFLASELNSSSW